jgi:hypothetical protein
VRRPTAIVLLVAAGCGATACGGASGGGASGGGASSGGASSGDASPGTAAPARLAARPALARAPRRPGEILVRGEASPASHGPLGLNGRYVVRFEQIAPEDPKLDFTTQTAFVATLDRRPEQAGADSVRLFRAAARTGRRTVTLRGRWYLDVSFGDFPYAIRLTPVGRR